VLTSAIIVSVSVLRGANLAVKFALELVAVAAFAFWGANVDGVLVSLVFGITAPAAAIVLWGRFAAPTSRHRLPTRARVSFELSVFALAAAALVAVDWVTVAIVFAVVAVVNVVLLARLGQLER
jgi:hypothetical protein